MNKAESLNIPSKDIQTFVGNRISLPVLMLSLSVVLSACGSEGVLQNEQFAGAESPELAINATTEAVVGVATASTDLSTEVTSNSSGVAVVQLATGSEVATGADVPVLSAAQPEPEPNLAPKILSTSLGCDLDTESVSIRMGDASEFFLLVDDESPLDLTYVVDMEKPDVASVELDSEGMLFVSGLTLGQTNLVIKVVDSGGLSDTIVVRIIIEL